MREAKKETRVDYRMEEVTRRDGARKKKRKLVNEVRGEKNGKKGEW